MRILNITAMHGDDLLKKINGFIGPQQIPLCLTLKPKTTYDEHGAIYLLQNRPDILVVKGSHKVKDNIYLLSELKARSPHTKVIFSAETSDQKGWADTLKSKGLIEDCWDRRSSKSKWADLENSILNLAHKKLKIGIIGGGTLAMGFAHILMDGQSVEQIKLCTSRDPEIVRNELEIPNITNGKEKISITGLSDEVFSDRDLDCIVLATSVDRLYNGGVAKRRDRRDLFVREARYINGWGNEILENQCSTPIISCINPSGHSLLLLNKLGVSPESLTALAYRDVDRLMRYIDMFTDATEADEVKRVVSKSVIGLHGEPKIASSLNCEIFAKAENWASMAGKKAVCTAIEERRSYLQVQKSNAQFFEDIARFAPRPKVNGLYARIGVDNNFGFAIVPTKLRYGSQRFSVSLDYDAVEILGKGVYKFLLPRILEQNKDVNEYLWRNS